MRKIKNILIIDDDPFSNFMTKNLILNMKASDQVFIAENGTDGLSLLKDGFAHVACPELVFLDLNMPVMDGIGFLEKYEGDTQLKGKNKIVMLTSSVNAKDIQKVMNFNIAGFISKPLTAAKFEKLMEDINGLPFIV
ncbi:MAG TPA: response regulator [Cytophagales bacterium]|nr:response regulator [Cytophagales bacterium]